VLAHCNILCGLDVRKALLQLHASQDLANKVSNAHEAAQI